MAIPETGNISIKEAAGSSRSIDTAVTSVSSGSLVTLGQNSIEYTDGRSSGTNDTNSSPYSMLEYAGYAHTSMDSWPSNFPGASGTEIQNWGTEDHQNDSGSGTAQAWCDAYFERDDANSRIKIRMKSGTAAAMATDYWAYITYSGMSSPAFYVKYNYTGSVINLRNEASYPPHYAHPELNPAISKDTYRQMSANGASGGKQFFWIAYRDAPQRPLIAKVASEDVTFTVKIVSGGVNYTASMPATDITGLEATFGQSS
jgi:hypothetical protein